VEPLRTAGRRPRGDRQRAFRAIFEAQGGSKPAGDQVYKVEHPTGTAELYFGAANPDLARTQLQAVFN
jgi:hypothetical protein